VRSAALRRVATAAGNDQVVDGGSACRIVRMVRMRAPVVVRCKQCGGASVSLMAAGDLVVIGKSARKSRPRCQDRFTRGQRIDDDRDAAIGVPAQAVFPAGGNDGRRRALAPDWSTMS